MRALSRPQVRSDSHQGLLLLLFHPVQHPPAPRTPAARQARRALVEAEDVPRPPGANPAGLSGVPSPPERRDGRVLQNANSRLSRCRARCRGAQQSRNRRPCPRPAVEPARPCSAGESICANRKPPATRCFGYGTPRRRFPPANLRPGGPPHEKESKRPAYWKRAERESNLLACRIWRRLMPLRSRNAIAQSLSTNPNASSFVPSFGGRPPRQMCPSRSSSSSTRRVTATTRVPFSSATTRCSPSRLRRRAAWGDGRRRSAFSRARACISSRESE